MYRALIAGAGLLLLVGCAKQTVQTHTINTVAAAEIALTAAEQLALNYTKLPRCGSSGHPKVCSDKVTVAKVLDLDNKAYKAVQMAKSNEALVDLAFTAITSLMSAVPKS